MAVTNTAGALKAFIEALGLALVVYRDEAPQGAALPHLVVGGPVTVVPDRLEDGGAVLVTAQPNATRATGITQTAIETMQVDLWQTWKSAVDNTLVEDSALPGSLIAALHGCRLPSHPKVVYGVLVRGAPRLFERDANLVHHAITVEVRRQI